VILQYGIRVTYCLSFGESINTGDGIISERFQMVQPSGVGVRIRKEGGSRKRKELRDIAIVHYKDTFRPSTHSGARQYPKTR